MHSYNKISLLCLSLFFISMGIVHFICEDFLIKIVPPILPYKAFIVYFSGILEIIFGIGILIARIRPIIAWLMISLLIAVFPANIYMFMHRMEFGFLPIWVHYLRLPLQLVLVAWVWPFTKCYNQTQYKE